MRAWKTIETTRFYIVLDANYSSINFNMSGKFVYLYLNVVSTFENRV